MNTCDGEKARSTAEMVARSSYGKLVAYLAARTGDVAAAEDALSEAFAVALADWPQNGCPSNPEAWLLTVARRKAIDMHRRGHSSDKVDLDLQQIAETLNFDPSESAIPDRRLALMFACAHPAIDAAIRAPLILQVILGLDAATIASAFLMSPAAMSKRLVRAKIKIREAGIPFHIPEREELPARLDTVLEATYAAYAEGWSDEAGTGFTARDLTGESLFLSRLLVELLPSEPEAIGLLALMLYAEARRPARRTERGEYVPLNEQNCDTWDQAMIDEAEALLFRASQSGRIGRYQLEAALQSAHIHRRRHQLKTWEPVLQIYDALFFLTGSPVVAINRSLVVAEIDGPRVALESLPDPTLDPRLSEYQPYWAARAELLTRIGELAEASRAYEIAIGLERDPAVRRFLEQRRMAVTK